MGWFRCTLAVLISHRQALGVTPSPAQPPQALGSSRTATVAWWCTCLLCRPGASEDALDDAERQLGIRLCPALRVLYRVHDGQELEFDRQVGPHLRTYDELLEGTS